MCKRQAVPQPAVSVHDLLSCAGRCDHGWRRGRRHRSRRSATAKTKGRATDDDATDHRGHVCRGRSGRSLLNLRRLRLTVQGHIFARAVLTGQRRLFSPGPRLNFVAKRVLGLRAVTTGHTNAAGQPKGQNDHRTHFYRDSHGKPHHHKTIGHTLRYHSANKAGTDTDIRIC